MSGMLKLICLLFLLGGGSVQAARTHYSVNVYGAVPDDGLDDGLSIRAAVAAAVSNGNAVVQFGQGTYHIAPPAGSNYVISIEDATNILFNGWGPTNTTIVITDPQAGGISISHCQEVYVQNMAFDYDPLPFTQGTLTSVDTDSFDIELDSGYLDLSDPIFSEADAKWGMNLLSDGVFRGIAVFASSWTNLSGRTWRMYPDDLEVYARVDLHVGQRYVHIARSHETHVIWFNNCEDCNLEYVHTYASCGGPITRWTGNTGEFINFYTVKIPQGSSRLISANGGGILATGSREGMLIQNCSFAGMADDGLNINGGGSTVVRIFSSNRFRVGVPGAEPFDGFYKVGDTIAVYDKVNGGLRGTATVTNVVQVSAQAFDLYYTPEIPDVYADSTWQNGDKVCNFSACGQGSVVKFCIFHPHRGRDVVLRTYNAQVRGCTFYNTEGWAVGLLHEYYNYSEGPPPYNVDIYDNCFYGVTNLWQPSIAIRSSLEQLVSTSAYDIHDIFINNNTFVDIRNEAVLASSCRDVFIVSNDVAVANGLRTQSSPTVMLEECSGIDIQTLNISDLNSDMYASVHIAETVASGTNSVSITGLNDVIAAGSVSVQDDRTGSLHTSAVEDAMVVGGSADSNYGSNTGMYIRHQNETWGNNYVLAKFDLSEIPTNAAVDSVRMRFYVGLGSWPATPTNFAPVGVFQNLEDWSEDSVTFNSRPSMQSSSKQTLEYFGLPGAPVYFTAENTISSGGWLEFTGSNVVNLVEGWIQGTVPNYGVSVAGDGDFLSDQRLFILQSSEHSNSNLWPNLIISYHQVFSQ